MNGELVATTTADRVRLNGFFIAARGGDAHQADGAVIVHGLAGNFYSSPLLLNIGNRLAGIGVHSVLANTRGHDVLNWTIRSGRSQTIGSSVEDVSECTHDLNAWSEYLIRQGCRRVFLIGHSLGAIKSLFAAAHGAHASLAGVVALSPTRLNYEQFVQSSQCDVFLATMAQAAELVAQGNPQQLMQIQFPFPTWMAAQAYLEKYGPENRFDWLAFSDRIAVPMLATFGELELRDNPAFEGLRDELSKKQLNNNNVEFQVVPGADHFYVACIELVCNSIVEWLDRQAKK